MLQEPIVKPSIGIYLALGFLFIYISGLLDFFIHTLSSEIQILISLIAITLFYGLYTIIEGKRTGHWQAVPQVVKDHFHTIWTYYGGLIKTAIIVNTFVLLLFGLIAAHLIPLDLGIFYWLWFGGILWGVNIIFVILAMLVYPESSK
jgi:hypothetical protein